MSSYPLVQLGDIADVVAGDPAPQDPKAFASDGPPFVRMQDVGRYHRHPSLADSTDHLDTGWVAKNWLRLFPKDSVLIPKSGASVNLNHRAKLATDAYVVSHLAIIIPDRTRIEPDYLYWWSASYDPRAQAQVTSLPSLKLSTLKSALVPLPSLDEQQRIVAILNRAAKIERLRKQAQQRLRKFIPALFIKMFGDPADNPMGWEEKPLGMLGNLDRGRSRHRPRNARELYGGAYPFVQTSDVANSDGLIRNASQTYSEFGLGQSRLWPAGTLCITIAANIEKTGVLEFDACFPDSISGFTPNETVTVEYVQSTLDLMQKRIEETAPMAAQRNINLRTLRELQIPVPSIPLQQRFAEVVESARAVSALETNVSDIGVKLVDSLMTRLLGAIS